MDKQTQSTDAALIAQEENELHNMYFHQKKFLQWQLHMLTAL